MAGNGGGKGIFFLIVILIVGAFLGTIVGNLVGMIVPADSQWRSLFVQNVQLGISPTNIDLQIIDLTFGFLFKFNLSSFIGVILAALLFRFIAKWNCIQKNILNTEN